MIQIRRSPKSLAAVVAIAIVSAGSMAKAAVKGS